MCKIHYNFQCGNYKGHDIAIRYIIQSVKSKKGAKIYFIFSFSTVLLFYMYPLFLATNKHHSFVREEIKAVKVVNISRVDQNYTNSSSFDTYVSCDGCLLIVNNSIAVHNIIVIVFELAALE